MKGEAKTTRKKRTAWTLAAALVLLCALSACIGAFASQENGGGSISGFVWLDEDGDGRFGGYEAPAGVTSGGAITSPPAIAVKSDSGETTSGSALAGISPDAAEGYSNESTSGPALAASALISSEKSEAEAPLAGYTVYLYDTDAKNPNTPTDEATTDAEGAYSFNDLTPGSYTVGIPLTAADGTVYELSGGETAGEFTFREAGAAESKPGLTGGIVKSKLKASEDEQGNDAAGGAEEGAGTAFSRTLTVTDDGEAHADISAGLRARAVFLLQSMSAGYDYEIDLSLTTQDDTGYTVTGSPPDLVLNFNSDANSYKYHITQTGNSIFKNILIASGVTTHIDIEGISLTSSATGVSPFAIASDATVNLTLIGSNSLISTVTSSGGNAGLSVPSGATLIINGSGSLTAEGGGGSAGLGGGASTAGGNITIEGGNITAKGGGKNNSGNGEGGAGIGGGYRGAGGNIRILGAADVTATGGGSSAGTSSIGYGGAGIGGGSRAVSGTITIEGGTVNATGGGSSAGTSSIGYGGAGIGSGGGIGNDNSSIIVSNDTITIGGGTVTAKGGGSTTGTGNGSAGYGGAGIGGGYKVTGGTIIITGGTVNATGGGDSSTRPVEGGAGIGGGSKATGSHISISGENTDVTATGGGTGKSAYDVRGGAGIGGGAFGGAGGTITVAGGTVKATGGGMSTSYYAFGGAGIGGGHQGAGGIITVTNGTVTATGGGGSDTDAYGGAGIGGGGGDISSIGGPGGTITVTNGTVTATGGGMSNSGTAHGGAGIGGGYNSNDGGTVNVAGSTVTATGGGTSTSSYAFGGAGIGGGYGDSQGSGNGNGGNITVQSGTVTATGGGKSGTGGAYGGAGIGGGFRGNGNGIGGNITVQGGTVTATGGGTSNANIALGGAGIGGGGDNSGASGNGGNINITGGKVEARGGGTNSTNAKNTAAYGGAGIGGGRSGGNGSGTGGDISISGAADVTAEGGGNNSGTGPSYGGAGIGGGAGGKGSGVNGTITVEGGTVKATGGGAATWGGAGIGGGGGTAVTGGDGGGITIGGNAKVTAKGYGAGIGGGRGATSNGAPAAVSISETAIVKAYSANAGLPAIHSNGNNDKGFYVNAQFTNPENSAAAAPLSEDLPVRIYIYDDGPRNSADPKSGEKTNELGLGTGNEGMGEGAGVVLPKGFACFAFTTKSTTRGEFNLYADVSLIESLRLQTDDRRAVARAHDGSGKIYSVGNTTVAPDTDPLPVKLRTLTPPDMGAVTGGKRTASSALFTLTNADTNGFDLIPNESGNVYNGFSFSTALTGDGKLADSAEHKKKTIPWDRFIEGEETGSCAIDDETGLLTMTAAYGATDGEKGEVLTPNTLYYLTAFLTIDDGSLFLEPASEGGTFKFESVPVEFSTLPQITSGKIANSTTQGKLSAYADFFVSAVNNVDIAKVRIYYSDEKIPVTGRPEGGPYPPSDPDQSCAGGDYVSSDFTGSPHELTASDYQNSGFTNYILEDIPSGMTHFMIEIENTRGDTAVLAAWNTTIPVTGAGAGGDAKGFLLLLCGFALLCVSAILLRRDAQSREGGEHA